MFAPVNDLPPCDTYDIGIQRTIVETYPGQSYGRAQRSSDGRLFVKVSGAMIEFVFDGGLLECIGLKDAESLGMEAISDEVAYNFEQERLAREQESLLEEEPPVEEEVFLPEVPIIEDLPEAPAEVESPQEDETPTEFSYDTSVIGGDGVAEYEVTNMQKNMDLFMNSLSDEAKDTLSRFLAMRPVFLQLSASVNGQMKGKLQGILYDYDCVFHSDGRIELPDSAFIEYPHWGPYKYE